MKSRQFFFGENESNTLIPTTFFTDLLSQIDNLGELKTTLYAFWYIQNQEGDIPFFLLQDFSSDKNFLAGLSTFPTKAEQILNDSLLLGVERGTFLRVEMKNDQKTIFILNNPRGRATLRAIQESNWDPRENPQIELSLESERPNIFQLYEKNIGPLAPMITEDLKEAEKAYPDEWVREAIHMAVQRNKRRWVYISAILKSWKEKGRHEEDRRSHEENGDKYIQGEYGDLIKH